MLQYKKKKAVNRKDRECQVALRSHRPRSPLRDPKRPAHACWRLGEPALYPLTGAGSMPLSTHLPFAAPAS